MGKSWREKGVHSGNRERGGIVSEKRREGRRQGEEPWSGPGGGLPGEDQHPLTFSRCDRLFRRRRRLGSVLLPSLRHRHTSRDLRVKTPVDNRRLGSGFAKGGGSGRAPSPDTLYRRGVRQNHEQPTRTAPDGTMSVRAVTPTRLPAETLARQGFEQVSCFASQ